MAQDRRKQIKNPKALLMSKYVQRASTQSPDIKVPPLVLHHFGILGHFA